MSHLLSSTAYFPPLAWYLAAMHAGNWQWEAYENYQKGGYRNRCKIGTANGPQWLSIPLSKGKHQATPIQEVQISDDSDWVRQHIRSIQAAYGRAPFFEFYAPEIFSFLENSQTDFAAKTKARHLWSLNLNATLCVNKLLGFPITIGQTDQFFPPAKDKAPLDVRNARTRLPLSPRPYSQLFTDRHGFQADLSILDLLFCLGPEAGSYLRQPTRNQ